MQRHYEGCTNINALGAKPFAQANWCSAKRLQ